MSETLTEPLPSLRHGEKFAQMNTDTFCVTCGYNLHGQPVTRDERLGLFVCRCPECGRFHPAGTGVTATTVWLNRLATALLVLWVLFVLHAIFWIVMGLGATQYVYIEVMTYRQMVDDTGAEVEWTNVSLPSGGSRMQMVKKGTTQPVRNWGVVYTLQPTLTDNPWDQRVIEWWVPLVICMMAAGVGLGAGLLLVVFIWHWPKKRYRWAAALPFAVALVMSVVIIVSDEFRLIRPWAIQVVMAIAGLQALALFAGTLIGRPIARTLLRMFVPPKPRQHFACLWQVDGKPPPGTALPAV